MHFPAGAILHPLYEVAAQQMRLTVAAQRTIFTQHSEMRTQTSTMETDKFLIRSYLFQDIIIYNFWHAKLNLESHPSSSSALLQLRSTNTQTPPLVNFGTLICITAEN